MYLITNSIFVTQESFKRIILKVLHNDDKTYSILKFEFEVKQVPNGVKIGRELKTVPHIAGH